MIKFPSPFFLSVLIEGGFSVGIRGKQNQRQPVFDFLAF